MNDIDVESVEWLGHQWPKAELVTPRDAPKLTAVKYDIASDVSNLSLLRCGVLCQLRTGEEDAIL